MAYNDKHRQFLQNFMLQRIMSETDANKINSTLFPDKNIDLTIEIINSKIIPLEFKINKTVCEQNGDISYVFIASFSDEFNSKRDLNKVIFTKLADHIIEAGGSVPYDNNLKTVISSLSDTILDAFFASKYLICDNNNNIFLSPLAISELEGYLVSKFVDRKCTACFRFVGYGIKCQFCRMFAHVQCLDTYFKNTGSQKCPKCSKQLTVQCNQITINYKIND